MDELPVLKRRRRIEKDEYKKKKQKNLDLPQPEPFPDGLQMETMIYCMRRDWEYTDDDKTFEHFNVIADCDRERRASDIQVKILTSSWVLKSDCQVVFFHFIDSKKRHDMFLGQFIP